MNSELRRLIEEAREKADLVDIISQSYPLEEAGGHYYRAVDHDSLVVDDAKQRWYWNSQGTQGDAIDWLRTEGGMTFREAIGYLLGRQVEHRAANRAAPTAITPPKNLVMVAEECHQMLLSSKSTVAMLLHQRHLRLSTILCAKLGWHSRMMGWTIPHWRHGNTDYCTGIKVRVVRQGKVRYVSVKGSRFELYMPPPLPNLDPSMLWIVEGEWKAMAVMQAGAYAVGCPAKSFRPEWWRQLATRFGQATVFAVRDNDLAGLVFLAKVRAAIPHALPLAPPIEYKSVDDWLAADPLLTLPNLIEDGIGHV